MEMLASRVVYRIRSTRKRRKKNQHAGDEGQEIGRVDEEGRS